MSRQNKIFRVFFSVTGVILLSKLLGFFKQMVTAGMFGATIETDLINLSESFIGDIKYVLVQTLLTSFVAIYLHIREENPEHAGRFAVDVGKAFSIITLAVTAAVMLLARPIAGIIAPSYSAQLSGQLAAYLRLFSPTLLLFVWIAIFHALLNANRRFIPGELEGANQSVILVVLTLTLAASLGVRVLAMAFLVSTVWNALFLGVVSRPYWQYSRGNPFQSAAVRQLLRMTGPLLLGYAMVYINQQVGKILVSGLEAGSVTAMGYAAVLSNLVGTLISSFCSILFTYITSHISKGEDQRAAELTTRSAVLLTLAFLPISILTILCAEEVVSVVFGRGAFGADDVRVAAAALAGYAFSFVPLALRELYSRFQYGYQNSKTPMINSTVGIAANIVLSIALCPRFGVLGVAFASSVSTAVCGALNLLTARRHNPFLRYGGLLRCLPWLCAGGVVCVLAARWGLGFWQAQHALVRFLLTTLCAGGAYFVTVGPLLWKLLRQKADA